MLLNALFITLTIGFTVIGQLLLRWRMARLGERFATDGATSSLVAYALDPLIWAVALSAFLAMASWSIVLARLPVSFAYPFMSLAYVGVLLGSWLLLGEHPTPYAIAGTCIVIVGISLIPLGGRA